MAARPAPTVRHDRTPVRTCVGCKERAAKSDLLRLVVVADDAAAGAPSQRVVPDPSGRRPGRGASLHRDLRCLDLAERRRAFPRAFRLAGPLDVTLVREHLESAGRS
ncbi:MAG TPA: YlxR family protein [Acidothermaceae bacterium]